MKYEFDKTLDHKHNASYRWDLPGMPEDLIGMGTADLDYTCAPCIRDALVPIAEENCYNYRQHTQKYYDAVTGWYKRCYGLEIRKEWLSNVPSTIGALRVAMGCFAKPGDAVLVQGPVFAPLTWAIDGAACRLVRSELQLRGGRYEIDFDEFESVVAKERPKLFLLVNPHNPTGRVFTRGELEKLVAICARYGVKIISDEVHCLVLFDGCRHTPILAVNDTAKEISVQVVSLSKGYNIMSLPHAIVTIANDEIRGVWNKQIMAHSFGYAVNSFAIAAVTSILQGEADEWMEQLTGYLRENRDHAVAYMKENGFPLTPVIPEGSFLLWIDGRDSGIDPEHMSDYFLNRCHIYLNNGADFGADGVGFFRMNFGVTKSVLEDALRRMKEAFAADGLLK